MMRASWHSRQAVVALACMGPGGSSAVGLAAADCCAMDANGEKITIAISISAVAARAGLSFSGLDSTAASRGALSKLCHMDFHLIDGVVEIAARIPGCGFGLRTPLAVGGARHDGVVARLAGLPVVAPEAPRVVGLFAA